MPESVDRPAPDSTTASPSASSRSSSSTAAVLPVVRATSAVGAAGTGSWSLVPRPRAAGGRMGGSAGGDRRVEPLQHLLVHPPEALGGEGALEEPAHPAGALPARADPH